MFFLIRKLWRRRQAKAAERRVYLDQGRQQGGHGPDHAPDPIAEQQVRTDR